MNLDNLNIEDFKIEKMKEISNSSIYSIKYKDDLIKFKLYNVKVPFGIEKYYNDTLIKIQINNESVKNLVYKIEDFISKFNDNKFKSQIKKNNNYPDLLIVKISNNKNDNTILNNDNSFSTMFDIKKNSFIDIEVYIDLIWSGKDIIVGKFKTKNLTIL